MNDEPNIEETKKNEDNSFKKLINVAVVIMLVGLIFIALFTFFFSMQAAISDLFDRPYVALVQSIFSLVVIAVGVYLIKMFLSK
jgi:membrane-anchored glycerophosphoryl diester phosphodiesterase (GDPDase)